MTQVMRFCLGLRKPLWSGSLAPTWLLFVPTLMGCAGTSPSAFGARAPAPTQPSRAATSAPVSEARPNALARGAAPVPSVAASAPHLPEIVLDPKQPLRSLPELKVENIGLHVGGGPNDAETKAPLERAVAQRFPAFLDCYRKNDDPEKGGRFGIDLHIPRGGGHPRIETPRTAMRGPEFRACLSSVFESVDFDKPKRGPTTISYSLRFTLGEAP